MDVEPVVFLAFLEGLVREDAESAETLDNLYAAARPKPRPTKKSREERRAEIQRFARLTAGEFA